MVKKLRLPKNVKKKLLKLTEKEKNKKAKNKKSTFDFELSSLLVSLPKKQNNVKARTIPEEEPEEFFDFSPELNRTQEFDPEEIGLTFIPESSTQTLENTAGLSLTQNTENANSDFYSANTGYENSNTSYESSSNQDNRYPSKSVGLRQNILQESSERMIVNPLSRTNIRQAHQIQRAKQEITNEDFLREQKKYEENRREKAKLPFERKNKKSTII